MSEGYQCDRCGSTHGGSPNTMLLVGDGRARKRPGLTDARERYEEPLARALGDMEADLCPACRNDLRAWWRDGGGDASDIVRERDSE